MSTEAPGALPWGVLWDMDGTLVDTEPYWMATEHELVARYGGHWSEADAKHLIGFDLLDSGRYIRDHAGVPLEPIQIVEFLLDGVIRRIEDTIPWRPGARELLAELNAAGVPCALVTMSWRNFADAVLAALPDGSFTVSIAGDEVPEGRGKPHPEPYILGATALNLTPDRCVAIEDSPTGARSAVTAGCAAVIGVPNVASLDGVDGIELRESLERVTIAELAAFVGAA